MSHRRKKKKKPLNLRKSQNKVEPSIQEEKPKGKNSNKLVEILIGILIFPVIIWAILEGSKTTFSKKTTLLIISIAILILVGVVIIGDK
ncbi:hypothetical protein NKR74_20775 [Bacillus sp. 3103sda1]|uniref:hypothetical protein n=1 Tax=Bacillus sp. 3103sda1 TaxID=2953808 RepID=UPI0020A0F5BA|nr:hypothetical protein [Bacillus sp. 3103sda1]MCP1125729.1 hypothetical protein [Bacillus sp. 3103sda1]